MNGKERIKDGVTWKSTVVFGDIHGLTFWEKIVDDNPECRYIFLGDYLDPYENIPVRQLIENLRKIIQLKKDRTNDVILLLGNHDLHYIQLKFKPYCRYDYTIEGDAHALFLENLHWFTYAYQEGNRIFTHAGISERWFFNDFNGDANKNIADQLNNPSPAQLPALHRCGAIRGGARFTVGGIFWADIDELHNPLPGYSQFVGHNRVENLQTHTCNGGEITFCDCLFHEKYLILG